APEGILTTIASTICTMGCAHAYSRVHMAVAVGPDHARILADGGLSRADVKRELHERARMPAGLLKRGGRYHGEALSHWPAEVDHADDDCPVPLVHHPDDILLFVAGGIPGPSSLIIPGWNSSSKAVTIRYRTD
ncbi:MAG: hypothetical protein V3V62_14915, partial [bacterium]